MATVTTVQLYELLSSKIGKPEAESLTTYIEEQISEEFKQNKDTIVSELSLKIEQLDSRLTSKIEGTKTTLMWAIIVLFLPMYLTIAIFLINYLKH